MEPFQCSRYPVPACHPAAHTLFAPTTATASKSAWPDANVIGCSTDHLAPFHRSAKGASPDGASCVYPTAQTLVAEDAETAQSPVPAVPGLPTIDHALAASAGPPLRSRQQTAIRPTKTRSRHVRPCAFIVPPWAGSPPGPAQRPRSEPTAGKDNANQTVEGSETTLQGFPESRWWCQIRSGARASSPANARHDRTDRACRGAVLVRSGAKVAAVGRRRFPRRFPADSHCGGPGHASGIGPARHADRASVGRPRRPTDVPVRCAAVPPG